MRTGCLAELIRKLPNPTIGAINQTLGRDASPTIACLRAGLDDYSNGIRTAHQSFREYITDSQKCDYRFLLDQKPRVKGPTYLYTSQPSRVRNLYKGFPLVSLCILLYVKATLTGSTV